MEKLPQTGSRTKSNERAAKKQMSPRKPTKGQKKDQEALAESQDIKSLLKKFQDLSPAQRQKLAEQLEQEPSPRSPPTKKKSKKSVNYQIEDQPKDVLLNKVIDQQISAQSTKALILNSVTTPKKISNPYMCFLKQNHVELREKNSELKQKEIFALIGQIWREMPEKEKYPYILQSEKDKIRYEQQMQDFETKGFFILEDGSKSTSAFGQVCDSHHRQGSPQKVVTSSPDPKQFQGKKFGQKLDANSLYVTDANSTMTTQSTLSANSQNRKKLTSKKNSKGAVETAEDFQHPSAPILDSPQKNSQKRQKRD